MLPTIVLDEREKRVLRAVIHHFIACGEPVSSRTLSKLEECPWSPATIRTIMADLMEAGYLEQPHRSSGRLPSDKGFRFYVEEIFTRNLDSIPKRLAKEVVAKETEMDRMLQVTPRLLASMTHHVGVILSPHFGHVRLNSINFIPLGNRRVLTILVARSGNVLNKVVMTGEDHSREDLIRFANYLTAEYAGMTLWQVREKIRRLLQQTSAEALGSMAGALTISDHLFSFMDEHDNDIRVEDDPENPATRSLLKCVVESNRMKDKLLHLLTRCIDANRTRVYIGSEDPFTEAAACSLIASTYSLGEAGHGAIGVIGTKAMAYDRVIPLVEEMAGLLNTTFSPRKEETHG